MQKKKNLGREACERCDLATFALMPRIPPVLIHTQTQDIHTQKKRRCNTDATQTQKHRHKQTDRQTYSMHARTHMNVRTGIETP